MNKFVWSAPWTTLASLMFACVVSIVYIKRRKKNSNNTRALDHITADCDFPNRRLIKI
jgi:hypothetical protein